jgi:hypothetical protein
MYGAWFIALGCAGCATTAMTKIDSSPQGAQVYLDGVAVGKTPLDLELDNTLQAGSRTLRFEAPGYDVLNTTISNSEVNVANAVGARLCLFPILWLHQAKAYNYYVMKPLQATPPLAPTTWR